MGGKMHWIINSAAECQILVKFGMWMHGGSAKAAQSLKFIFRQIQDGKRRFIGYIWIAITPPISAISLKF